MASRLMVQMCAILELVRAILELLYKWMPFHLVYTITMLVCEDMQCKGDPTVWAIEIEYAM